MAASPIVSRKWFYGRPLVILLASPVPSLRKLINIGLWQILSLQLLHSLPTPTQETLYLRRTDLKFIREMAEAIILGALAQEVLQEVVRVILHMKGKTFNFREDLEELRISLEYVVPILKQGWKLNSELDFSKPEGVEKFKEKLQKGKELVSRCYKIPSWNIIQRLRYASKISKFDETIRRFCGLELQVENWRDNKVLLQKMNELALHQVPSLSTINKGLFAVPQLPNHLVGFDIAIRELKIELFKENVTVLGVCAPGGCGKSTLAAMLCRDEEVRVAFKDKILFLTVSRNPIVKILQRLIEEIGNGVSRSDLSEEDAIKQFHYLLEERRSQPLLLVLDDVWEESIIEKVFSRNKGCKMLVTSREAFKVYNSENHSKYLLKTLNPQDSKSLFRQTSLSQDGNDEYKPDENLLNEIVQNCEGFPLAITVIAKSLSQQPAVKWSNMAKKLSNGASIFNIDEKLQKCLATSLEFLDATLLECFMDLGSFPEDKRISASALIDIWCERYELDSEDEAYINLLELASRNLVNLVGSRKIALEIDASFNELFVTQHDLLRDLAIYQSQQKQHQGKRLIMYKREKGLPESWTEQENPYLNARLVSLCTGEMGPESWYDLQLPKDEVLILNFSASNYALPPFMEKMRKLKVLIIVNRGRNHAKLDNLKTLSELANLRRIRLERVSIPSLHEFPVSLMNLQKISLVMCDFGQALMKGTINVSYMLPNLFEINIDYCHDLVELPPWICGINNLQTLSITNCDNLSALPERIGDLANLELLRLHACTGLPKLPDSIQGLQKLRFLDISDCCNLKMLPDGMGELRCLKKLDVRGCIDLSELPPSAMKLVHLKEVTCDEDAASLWEPVSSCLKITVLKKDNNLDWLGVDI